MFDPPPPCTEEFDKKLALVDMAKGQLKKYFAKMADQVEDDDHSALTHDFGDYDKGYDYVESKEGEGGGYDDPDWEKHFDDESKSTYWYHNKTGETTWDEPAWTPMGNTTDYDYSQYGEGEEWIGEEVDHDPSGVKQALAAYTVPPLVPKRWTDFGQSILFHGIKNPSPFFRINVFEADNPSRER